MSVNYVNFEQAIGLDGIKLQVIKGIPSPWSEAAKAILYIKKIDYFAVFHDPFNQSQTLWFESNSAPSLKFNQQAAKVDWHDILKFAEEHSPSPSLLPHNSNDKEEHLQLCHALCSQNGLGWYRRLQSVHQGLLKEGGFPYQIALYLADKYGYQQKDALLYESEVIRILHLLELRLSKQKSLGKAYYFSDQLSALDIYSAMFMAYFKPLPNDVCSMYQGIRTAFEDTSLAITQALDPILLEHRDFIYNNHLELPLSL